MHIWGEPVLFGSVKVHPIRVKDAEVFYEALPVLQIAKHKLPSAKLVKMPYLDFLYAMSYQDPTLWDRFLCVAKLVFQEQVVQVSAMDKHLVLVVDDSVFSVEDFERWRHVVLEQNGLSLDVNWLDTELEKELAEAEAFLRKKDGKPASFEDQVVALHCLSGLSYEVVSSYTLYQFQKTLERFAMIKHFEVYTPVMIEHGMGKDVRHWLGASEPSSRYGNGVLTKEQVRSLVSQGQLNA